MGKKKNTERSSGTSKRILVAPLDWGLGHATRCIPIIQTLLQQGHQVFLAGGGKVQHLLQTEFPQLPFLPLPGYEVHYTKKGWNLPFTLLLQLPKIAKAIKREHDWLKNTQTKYSFNTVISDNRFGLHHPHIHSIFITHQLLIKAPFRFAEKLLQYVNYRRIQHFDECWVPDVEAAPGFAGVLSHPQAKPPVPVRYIGSLSRFSSVASYNKEQKHLLVLLSGPEPQRSILENLLFQQLADYEQPVVFVRGLPGTAYLPEVAENVHLINHLSATALLEALQEAHLVIARSGYSTIMDLMELQQKSILIPTPGQTEQEYLAKHLLQQQYALCVAQNKFELKTVLQQVQAFPFRFPKRDLSATQRIGACFGAPADIQA